MTEVIPAVLAKNYEEMKDKIALVRGICPVIQIDFCDGIFVKTVTWPFLSRVESRDFLKSDLDEHFRRIINEQEGMPFWQDIDFELDLMVADAVENFDIYTKLGPKRIIFHIEAVGNLEEFKDFLEGMDIYMRDSINIGVAINPNTPIEKIFSLVNNVDFVQCMGIEKIGFQGQDFDERVLGHIKTLREKYSDLIISVDGGVNFETAPKLIKAGADRLVAGSLILKSNNIRETISELESLG
jgi:ribulose-phosphate 3-epimerase